MCLFVLNWEWKPSNRFDDLDGHIQSIENDVKIFYRIHVESLN